MLPRPEAPPVEPCPPAPRACTARWHDFCTKRRSGSGVLLLAITAVYVIRDPPQGQGGSGPARLRGCLHAPARSLILAVSVCRECRNGEEHARASDCDPVCHFGGGSRRARRSAGGFSGGKNPQLPTL